MARPLVLSNGRLHVGINNFGLVHDFYYPHVGFENHATGESLRHKVGIWVNGQLSWLDDGAWTVTFSSATDSLVGHVKARNDSLKVLLEFDDFVDSAQNVLFRNIHVVNLDETEQEIRLFMHQAFIIGDSHTNTDTAQYLPASDAILHYRGDRCFVIGGQNRQQRPFDQHSIGLFGIEGREGTYKDAEDGELSNGNVEHGRVDSTIRFKLNVAPHSSERVHYWIAAGMDIAEAVSLHDTAIKFGLESRLRETITWWHEWIRPAKKVATQLPKEYQASFLRSTILVKSHIDESGAVIASTDSGMLHSWRDAYAYFWPRDGAYALWPLIRMGYTDEALKFFAFCKSVLHANGYLMHKFRADGALGSSWHPYLHGDTIAPPIQEDETAVTAFLFCQYYKLHSDKELIDEYYETMIRPMADFMVEYVDSKTHLPKPSYDLWEEVFLTTTYTTAVTQAALYAVSDLAESINDNERAVKWRSAADDMRDAAMKLLYDHKENTFRKGILAKDDVIEYQNTIDSASFYGAFMYGLVSSDSDELRSMSHAMIDKLGQGSTLKIPRYENDTYMRPPNGLSNGWYITTLWLAQYYNENNQTQKSRDILDWVTSKMSSTGMLSEQITIEDEQAVSVSPLTWSHAEYIGTLLDFVSEA